MPESWPELGQARCDRDHSLVSTSSYSKLTLISMQALHINGNDLTLEDVRQVVYERRPVLLQPEARMAVERARAVVEDLVERRSRRLCA